MKADAFCPEQRQQVVRLLISALWKVILSCINHVQIPRPYTETSDYKIRQTFFCQADIPVIHLAPKRAFGFLSTWYHHISISRALSRYTWNFSISSYQIPCPRLHSSSIKTAFCSCFFFYLPLPVMAVTGDFSLFSLSLHSLQYHLTTPGVSLPPRS